MKKCVRLLVLIVLLVGCISLHTMAEENQTMLAQYRTYNMTLPASDGVMGMGYVMRADNGELFVIDGGFEADAKGMLALLKEISGEEKPHVAMWFLSHPHLDHYGALMDIGMEHYKEITVDKVLANFPPRDIVPLTVTTSYASGVSALRTIKSTLKPEMIVPHTGETYHVGNIDIDIVTTWEDLKQVNDPNESSTVLMASAAGQKILFLADAYPATVENVLKNYGDQLSCDIVQVAHHGSNGCSVKTYESTGAQLFMIPNTRTAISSYKNKFAPTTWVLEHAPEILYAGDGTTIIPLPYEVN